jgi:hypothetical protein
MGTNRVEIFLQGARPKLDKTQYNFTAIYYLFHNIYKFVFHS